MRQTRSRQHDRKCRLKSSQVKSVYFNHPSQGNSTNYSLILGLRDKAAPSTSQQINKFHPKRVKNLATPSCIFIFISSSSTAELCSQPVRGNVHRIGRMFPEHVERSFLDPEYSFAEYFQLGSRRKVGPIKNQLASPNTSNWVREETFTQLRTGLTQLKQRAELEKIKVNGPGRQKLEQGKNSWQWAKHAWLYSDRIQALVGDYCLSAVGET